MADLVMLLTPEQRSAVIDDGHVCLVSCPGSGKTRVIVAKLLRCIEGVRGSARRVACITHTNAGAEEIESRLRQAAFSGEDEYYEISTIHAFALQNIVRPFHKKLTTFKGGFTLLTSDDEAFQIKRAELMAAYGMKAHQAENFDGVYRFPDGGIFVPDGFSYSAGSDWCRWLDESSFTTLGDLVYHACLILDRFSYIASAIASRFAWILVDEFQDSSGGQVHLFKAIARFHRSTFFCVGDPNQSIYGFSGATPGLLTSFAGHVSASTKHRLTGNFRSSQAIVTIAEHLCPTTPSMKAVGPCGGYSFEPKLVHVSTPLHGITEHFLPAVDDLDVPYGKVAILAPWWVSLFHLSRGLRAAGFPVIGPGARPYKRSWLFSHLAEPLGAYMESQEGEIAFATQRGLFFVLTNITNEARANVFSYAGRVVVCQVLQAAAAARSQSPLAVEWLKLAARLITDVLLAAKFLPENFETSLIDSAEGMIADIMDRDQWQTLTIEDLGIFARPKECIQLMTIHKSKGREFEAVAVVDAHDDVLPHFTVAKMTDHALRQARYDESRRLTYVAATRAMRVLMFFTDPSRERPSPFLREMGF